ncbi:MAG: segregation/condensation protein A [Myxococcota bacterium]|nr:segregation/condensation protein A [Myxococcota bacterium]
MSSTTPMSPAEGGRPDDIVVVSDPVNGAPGAYAVKLDVFEGPLDLLLHLIRQNEVEITDIPVAKIAKQYLQYIEMMRELQLDVAGEYLVMAATLALIKSRMLLPPDGQEEDGEGFDPRAELVQRLLEYQRYKEVAELLGRRRLLDRDVFEARGAEPSPVPDAEREIEVGLFELLDAFRQVLERADDDDTVHAVELETETFTVRERVIAIMELLEEVESIEFAQIFEQTIVGPPSRQIVVASFLAVLELTRLEALRIYQGLGELGSPEGPIRLRAIDTSNSALLPWRERISDLM